MSVYLLALIIGLTAAIAAAVSYFLWLQRKKNAALTAWRTVAERLGLTLLGDDAKSYPAIEGVLDGVKIRAYIERDLVGYITFHETLCTAELPSDSPAPDASQLAEIHGRLVLEDDRIKLTTDGITTDAELLENHLRTVARSAPNARSPHP